MNDERIMRLMHEVAVHEVPASPKLWPAIQARLASSCPTYRLGSPHRVLPSLPAIVAACLLILAIVSSLLTSIGPAQAAIWQTLQRFGVVLVASTPLVATPGTPLSTPTQAPATRETALLWVSLAEAQQQVPFRIPLPTWVPEGVMLQGAFVGKGPSTAAHTAPLAVTLSYQLLGNPMAGMSITIRDGPAVGGYAVPAGTDEETVVNGRPAIFIRGAWTREGAWNATADATMLSWEVDGFTYVVSTSGLGLTREEVVWIAESLR